MEIQSTQRDDQRPRPRRAVPAEGGVGRPRTFNVDGFAAALADLVYCRDGVVRRHLEAVGAERVTILGSPPRDRPPPLELYRGQRGGRSQMTLVGCVHEGRAWLAFRGTDEWDDWAVNLRAGLFTHPGFRTAWSSVADATHRWVQSVTDHDLVVTGHSLGGAIATLAAESLARTEARIEAVVTFGAPRVGSPGFARRWNALPTRIGGKTLVDVTRRYETPGEAVSHVPPWLFGFKHVGREGRFQHGGNPFHDPADPLRTDHWLIRRIRTMGLEAVPLATLPLMVLKALVFGIDRGAHHRMDLYFTLMDAGEARFPTSPSDRDGDYALGHAHGGTLLLLAVVGGVGLLGILGLFWIAFTSTTVHPVAVLTFLVVGLLATPRA